MSQPAKKVKESPLASVAQVVAPNIILVVLWILISDRVASPLKGWLFVAVTAGLLSVLLRCLLKQINERQSLESQVNEQALNTAQQRNASPRDEIDRLLNELNAEHQRLLPQTTATLAAQPHPATLP